MHDATYKLLFSHRRMVADLLRGFLPGGAALGFDFDTLEPLSAAHVGRALDRREGDLMWRLRARSAADGGWVYVLVLLEFQSGVDRRMALRVLTYTGLAWEGLSRRTARGTPLPPVVPMVIYNGASPWTAPEDVAELIAPAPAALARLQPSNRCVVLDIQRASINRLPVDNTVSLQVALERSMPSEAPGLLRRAGALLAGPEHAELRTAFAEWVWRSWTRDYGLPTDESLRGELVRMAADGEVETMASLMVEKWKKREEQILARGETRGLARGRAQVIESERRLLGRQAALRHGAETGKRLSALLTGVSEPERLALVGEAIIKCGTDAELLAAARRILAAE